MMVEPTAEQAEQCAIVQQEVLEAVERLLCEGFDRQVVLAGLTAATAAMAVKVHGKAAMPRWFARQTALAIAVANRD